MDLPNTDTIVRFLDTENPRIKDDIFDFFVTFSRFEYAMKQSPAFRYVSEDEPKASWRALSKAMDEYLVTSEDPVTKEAIQRLITKPPKKIALINDRLYWQEITGVGVLDAIQIVRNNLFHGGKFLEDKENRNAQLVRDCSIILKYCLKCIPELSQFYSAL